MERPTRPRSRIPTSRSRARHSGALRSVCAVALALLVGCGSSSDASLDADATPVQPLFNSGEPASGPCAQSVVGALGSIARRVYREADGGRIALEAVTRLERSPMLRRAVEGKDPAATRAALQRLAESQIVRSQVMSSRGTLADVGNKDAIAPVGGTIRNAKGAPIATFKLSVLGGEGYTATLVGLIGVKSLVRSGSEQLGTTLQGVASMHIPATGKVTLKGVTYDVLSFPGRAFSGRTAQIFLLTGKPAASLCGSSSIRTSTNTIGAVGERIYKGEQAGGKTVLAVRTAEESKPFRRAVETGNLAATRAAIIEFFANRSHVVRVRVYRKGKLFTDVGGPHVLAPATGTLRDSGGQRIGTFQLAIQDDRGYMLLAHNFTGAQVLLRRGSEQVIGTLEPGPASLPDRGSVTYAGKRYQVFSFMGEAFPSGGLRISLLVGPT